MERITNVINALGNKARIFGSPKYATSLQRLQMGTGEHTDDFERFLLEYMRIAKLAKKAGQQWKHMSQDEKLMYENKWKRMNSSCPDTKRRQGMKTPKMKLSKKLKRNTFVAKRSWLSHSGKKIGRQFKQSLPTRVFDYFCDKVSAFNNNPR